ncbi:MULTISPECIES: CU044_5270 family protein [Kitasatospora]|uniref:CU044_5270 family protein n=1 Tax=Kitasatospora setae (strain ATCC 33774 / DSM 43861 / JCM 3304 / KCC A-0304 / NBRC 14216 / KM-6054) TaxID=452652 RepID=E4MZS7_KITSK|nr:MULTISPECIES: CU044_5270 family protein [Kitasatospora]BAJ30011.1 hypothetical protein KSE_42260 [Kitasatospora setae KM-6054]
MDEIARLAEFRADTAPLSAPARSRGRRQLAVAAAAAARRPSWWRPARGRPLTRRGLPGGRRRLLVAVAMTLALTAGVAGSQLAGPGAGESSAQAVSVLNLAADAVVNGPMPRPDQYVYIDVLDVTSLPDDPTVSERWISVDGSRPNTYRLSGAYVNRSGPLDPYGIAGSLLNASYLRMAELPTDPEELLKILRADPFVDADLGYPGMTRDVGVWDLIRSLLTGPCPPAQQAALFRAAARLPGIGYVEEATDALGRPGEAVALFNPRVGRSELVLDRKTHAFLGERVLGDGPDGKPIVALNSAVRTVAFVDGPGRLPS